jgi:hypothetical protein
VRTAFLTRFLTQNQFHFSHGCILKGGAPHRDVTTCPGIPASQQLEFASRAHSPPHNTRVCIRRVGVGAHPTSRNWKRLRKEIWTEARSIDQSALEQESAGMSHPSLLPALICAALTCACGVDAVYIGFGAADITGDGPPTDSPHSIWNRMHGAAHPDSLSWRLMSALRRSPGFDVDASFLNYTRVFHRGGTGYIDGIAPKRMSVPLMWGVDPAGRFFVSIRTVYSFEYLGSHPASWEIGENDPALALKREVEDFPDRLSNAREYRRRLEEVFTDTFADAETGQNYSTCARVRRNRDLGVVTVFERFAYAHSCQLGPPWTVGSHGGHWTNGRLFGYDVNLIQRYLGDDGGQEAKALFRLLAFGETHVHRMHRSGNYIVFRYSLQ